ncbi:MAG TPA: enoyl-CoA hydratase-related protein [Thermomicrobiales bacterium]|nr:enoyl-CoA hydratase-related protein [Thermomicrobiales bacterium]
MDDDILLYERRGAAIWLTMNRPEVRNALARELVQALRDGLDRASADPDARAIVLAGAGRVFCAGADVNQYRVATDRDALLSDGGRLFDLLEAITVAPKPVIARVQRAAFGGALGLIAAADLVVAADDTRFSLSEARLGLVAAMIGTSVVRAVGPRHARAMMLLAEPFGAAEALRTGLIQRAVPEAGLDTVVDEWVSHIRANAPGSMRDSKLLVNDVAFGNLALDEQRRRCMELAADRRADPEGQEGMRAYLEKRPAAWNVDA